jgi:tRNA (cmo5U34)-methyltransferase
MSASKPNFDVVALLYDDLARLVFGNAIDQSQRYFLNKIPTGASILVLGGGTGRFLPELFRINPTCNVWFIDSSVKMISQARKNVVDGQQIHFIAGTEESIPPVTFDIVITFFFLDLFPPEKLARVIEKIKRSLTTDALWLAADFVPPKRRWQILMLRVMFIFFRWICKIESHSLVDWRAHLLKSGFETTQHQDFYSGFIESRIYR